jgi:hypothetical protein
VFETFGAPLSLACALMHAPRIDHGRLFTRTDRSLPLVQMGCYTRDFVLEKIADVARQGGLERVDAGLERAMEAMAI